MPDAGWRIDPLGLFVDAGCKSRSLVVHGSRGRSLIDTIALPFMCNDFWRDGAIGFFPLNFADVENFFEEAGV